MAFALSDVSLAQSALVASTAFVASIIGGVAGYGTGLLLPLALVPIIGAEATVPVIAISALFTNASRALALRRSIDWSRFRLMLPAALPMTMLAATLFTRLDNRGAAIVIGCVLIALVPLRHWLKRAGFRLQGRALAAGGGIYGFVTGGSTGAGVILVSFLMASGLTGAAVVATDAAISIVIGAAKAATFGALGALPGPLLVFALLVGLSTVPGAFIARHILERLSLKIQTALLDAVVVIGGAVMVVRALLA
ncbi:MAG TPA: sulfite exporter TauE/SafE family protein [Beijerinckiaceae bacterium]|nr:sulfite exporter TauE/SafE family protein [Beijerinckiaceae bacterium]